MDLFQVPETLSPDTLKAMSAADKPSDVMVLDRSFLNTLPQYDGLMFGMPTRFGMMAAQMKAFFDGTGGLWQSGALAGKLAATFVSTGTQQGGQETTHFTAVTQLVHHGMAYVPLGYQAGVKVNLMSPRFMVHLLGVLARWLVLMEADSQVNWS